MRRASYVLNDKEKKVCDVLASVKDDKDVEKSFLSLKQIAGKAFNKRGTEPKTKGNSWVRNSMRKLVRLGLVKGKGPKSGLYSSTGLDPAKILADAERQGLILAAGEEDLVGEAKAPKRKRPAKGHKAAKAEKPEKPEKVEKYEKAPRKRAPRKSGATARGKRAAKVDNEGEPVMSTETEEKPEAEPVIDVPSDSDDDDMDDDDDDDVEEDEDDGDEEPVEDAK